MFVCVCDFIILLVIGTWGRFVFTWCDVVGLFAYACSACGLNCFATLGFGLVLDDYVNGVALCFLLRLTCVDYYV